MGLRRFFSRTRADVDHAREFESFIEIETDENIARGMPPHEARRAAQMKFGNRTALREEVYEMNRIPFLETLARDIRHAVRVLVASPAFTLVSLVTLALGIGATTAIFTVTNSVILRPLPYPDSNRLLTLWAANPAYHLPGHPAGTINFSPGDFLDLRNQNRSFDQLGAFTAQRYTRTGGAQPDRIEGGLISAELLSTLGVRPALGRLFVHADDSPAADRVAVLSYSVWIDQFGGSPTVIGATIGLDDHAHTIVGVMPAGFHPFEENIEVWLPIERKLSAQEMHWRFSYYVRVVGRLKPGIRIEQARLDADRIVQNIRRQFPDDISQGAMLTPLLDSTVDQVRAPLLLFLGAVGFVLLIACANVANLNLARAITRQREIALRLALGAGRNQIVRQLFTESMVLATAGCALGLAVAAWGVRGLLQLAPDIIPRAAEIHVDAWVFGFAMLAATASALVFGLWPALAASKSDPLRGMKATPQRARSGLVICEIALALVLMIGGGLLLESFHRVTSVDPGFDPHGMIAMRVALSPARYDTIDKQSAFYQKLIDRLRAMPQLKAASAIDGLPFTDGGFDNSFVIDGRPEPPKGHPLQADLRRMDPGYFAAMNIPLLAGRPLAATDRAGAPLAFVISASMARKYFANESAIGKRLTIYFGPPGGIHGEVVGVAGDVRSALDGVPGDIIYFSYAQGVNVRRIDLVLRPAQGTGSPAEIARAVRAAVASVDPDQPAYRLFTMEELFSLSLATRRFEMLVLAIFAALAGCLAAVGLYGMLAYSVQARTKEIGIRTALGASHGQVSAMVLSHALKLTAAGMIAGVLAALGLTRLLSSLLFGVRPADPPTFIVVSLLLLLVAIAAGYLPARRAARIDPLIALRHD